MIKKLKNFFDISIFFVQIILLIPPAIFLIILELIEFATDEKSEDFEPQ